MTTMCFVPTLCFSCGCCGYCGDAKVRATPAYFRLKGHVGVTWSEALLPTCGTRAFRNGHGTGDASGGYVNDGPAADLCRLL